MANYKTGEFKTSTEDGRTAGGNTSMNILCI